MILCLETATPACSVALVHDGRVVALEENLTEQSHAEKITLYIEKVMLDAHVAYNDLDAVAISMGPGSYTGLRIGVSTAKGLCYAIEKPLIGIDTLHAMAFGGRKMIKNTINPDDLFCPMIDARRMEVYAAFFDCDLDKISPTEAIIIEKDSFLELKKNHNIYLFGDGADKCYDLFQDDQSINVIRDFHPSAKYMTKLAEEAFEEQQFLDVAYCEPYYLKNFVPGAATVKGLYQ